jgi:hypothetical protein
MTKYIPFVERAFDQNDWFILINCVILYGIMYTLPKRFPKFITYQMAIFSITIAGFFDNSFGDIPFDFYDIMDGPAYTVMDAVVYFIYPPLGYFFIYIYDRFNFRGRSTFYYILSCSFISVIYELICVKFQVFHYKNGYGAYFSFVIYLFFQTLAIFFYRFLIAEGYGNPQRVKDKK